MIEIRRAQDDISGSWLLDPFGHTSGLLSRRHAQHSMRQPKRVYVNGLNERTGDFASGDRRHLVAELWKEQLSLG